jgi:hypothetical protein
MIVDASRFLARRLDETEKNLQQFFAFFRLSFEIGDQTATRFMSSLRECAYTRVGSCRRDKGFHITRDVPPANLCGDLK